MDIFKKIIRKLIFYIKKPYTTYLNKKANKTSFQKTHWETCLTNSDWTSKTPYGYHWGNPENDQDRLGNYKKIKDSITSKINADTTILDLGCLAGKWTQYFLEAKKIICVDLNETSFQYIRDRFNQKNIDFYLTQGNELNGIPDQSVDILFSMDTLVRVEKQYIFDYLKASLRVLKENGEIFLHLPCQESPGSRSRSFTKLSLKELKSFMDNHGFKSIDYDFSTITHGCILTAKVAPLRTKAPSLDRVHQNM